MAAEPTIEVEVAYALPHRQVVEKVALTPGSTARDAIERSGVLGRFPEIDLATQRVGVYGRIITLDTVVEDGERVEIYRPLQADPKAVRRRLAREGKTMGRGRRSSPGSSQR